MFGSPLKTGMSSQDFLDPSLDVLEWGGGGGLSDQTHAEGQRKGQGGQGKGKGKSVFSGMLCELLRPMAKRKPPNKFAGT